MPAPIRKQLRGEILVTSRIIDYLSSGLYESPAACLKELINNSYDADATSVEVFVKPDANRIIISDNGSGISLAEFLREFTRISESHKRDESSVTALGRPKVGKIGIGFIAANEICEQMEIISTTRGSKELLSVVIDFEKMRQGVMERRRDRGGSASPEGTLFAKADYYGEVLEAPPEEHYTQIFLLRVRGEARQILAGAHRPGLGTASQSLYGLDLKSLASRLRDPGLASWSQLDTYSTTMLEVGLNVPIRYFPEWVPPHLKKAVSPFETRTRRLKFALSYDGAEVRRPILLGHTRRPSFILRFDHHGPNLSADGYLYVQHGAIKPQELNGLLLRIRHAAVGRYDATFMNYPTTEGTLFQRWISAEIWAGDALEEAMNIDRRTLRVSHPAYVELQAAIHDALSDAIKAARRKLYERGSRRRVRQREERMTADLRAFAQTELSLVDPLLAKRLAVDLATATPSAKTHRVRRFTVVELFGLVLRAARTVLRPKDARLLLRELYRLINK